MTIDSVSPELRAVWDAFHNNPRHAEIGDPIPAPNLDDFSHLETLAGLQRVLDFQHAIEASAKQEDVSSAA